MTITKPDLRTNWDLTELHTYLAPYWFDWGSTGTIVCLNFHRIMDRHRIVRLKTSEGWHNVYLPFYLVDKRNVLVGCDYFGDR